MDYKKVIETLQFIYDIAQAKAEDGDERGVIYINLHRISDLKDAISSVQELQTIHNNGISLERLKDIDFRKEIVKSINYDAYVSLQGELEEYREIGTLEEVREAVEKQKAKKPYEFGWVTGLTGRKIYKRGRCKNCGCLNVSCNTAYCKSCGQHIDWSEVQE